jgi:hypothetical protein
MGQGGITTEIGFAADAIPSSPTSTLRDRDANAPLIHCRCRNSKIARACSRSFALSAAVVAEFTIILFLNFLPFCIQDHRFSVPLSSARKNAGE